MVLLLHTGYALIVLVVLRLLALKGKHYTVPGRQYQSVPCPERELVHFQAAYSAEKVVVTASVSLLLSFRHRESILSLPTYGPTLSGNRQAQEWSLCLVLSNLTN